MKNPLVILFSDLHIHLHNEDEYSVLSEDVLIRNFQIFACGILTNLYAHKTEIEI